MTILIRGWKPIEAREVPPFRSRFALTLICAPSLSLAGNRLKHNPPPTLLNLLLLSDSPTYPETRPRPTATLLPQTGEPDPCPSNMPHGGGDKIALSAAAEPFFVRVRPLILGTAR